MENYVNTFRIDNMKYQLDGELCKHIPNRQHEIRRDNQEWKINIGYTRHRTKTTNITQIHNTKN